MNKILTLLLLFLIISTSTFAASYTWTGGVSSSWNNQNNWSPSTGVPGSSDDVIITAAGNSPVLSANQSCANFTIGSGTLNLGGFTLLTSGNNTFTGGTIQNGIFSTSGSGTSLFTNTTFSANCTVSVNTGLITINGGTFGGDVTLIQNGSTQSTGSGNATFNGNTFIEAAGSGNFRTNGNITFNGPLTLRVSNSGYLLLELNSENYFNNTVTGQIVSGGTGNLRMCYKGNNVFNNNIVLENQGSGAVYFCEQNTASAQLTAGKTITTGGGGFTDGKLYLYRFTQTGSTAQTMTFTGNSRVELDACNFDGNVTFQVTDFYTSNSIYNGTFSCTKTGGSNNYSAGGNTFGSTAGFSNTSNSHLIMGNSNPDIFNGDININNSGTAYVILANNSPGNQFNGNIIVSQNNTGSIYLGNNNSSSGTLANGKTITASPGNFTNGNLYLTGFTQLGTTAQNILVTGNGSVYLSNNSTFNGSTSIEAPDIYVRGAVFNSSVSFTKTGGTSNHNSGVQNIFNGTCTINQQSSSGYFMLGYNSNDLFNDNIIVTSNNTGGINLGWTNGTGTPTLAAGKTVSIGGSGFSDGYLRFGGFTQLGNAPISLNFSGSAYLLIERTTQNCSFGGNFTVSAPDIYVRGGTFNGNAEFTKTGGTSNHNSGVQNIFNGTCTINQQSSGGYFMLGYNSNDLFNDNIIVNSNNTGGIQLGYNGGTGTPTLAAGKTVMIGGSGFSDGYLRFGGFTQLGSSAINLNFTGNSYLVIDQAGTQQCNFGGSFTATAIDIYVRGAVFNSAAAFTKTGGTSNHNGGYTNIFNSTCTINQQSSSGYFALGYNSPDEFHDNIIVTSTGSGGIYLGLNSGTGTPTLAAGKTILVGGAGFSNGFLYLNTFTQNGSAPINLSFTGTDTYFAIGRSSDIGGNITITAPRVFLHGSVFRGTSHFEKTGTYADGSNGGNIFQGNCEIINSGQNYLLLGNSNPDIWNANVIFTSSGSTTRILPAWSTAGNQFNGDIYVNSLNNSTGIYFCGGNTTATSILAAGHTIAVGTSGYSSGYLVLRQFTQLGNTPVSLLLTPTASQITYGPSSQFGGNVTSVSPGLYFNGCTFNGTNDFNKTGSSNDASNGGNIFNGVSHFTNSGSGYLLFGNGTSDQFNATATFDNTGSNNIFVAYNGSGHIFNNVNFNNAASGSGYINVSNNGSGTALNGNVTVSSTSGGGVQFGPSNGSAVLASGKTITINSNGFSAGTLLFKGFTQTDSNPISFTLTGTAVLNFNNNSTFNGNITAVSPSILFSGSTFNGTNDFTKNGSMNSSGSGGCTFNGNSIFKNTGTGYLMLANGTADDYNANVTFVQSSSGNFYPNYNANCTYSGNISTVGSVSSFTFGAAGNGRMTIDGTSNQNFDGPASFPPVVTRMTMANTGQRLNLNVNVEISVDLSFTSGFIQTTAATTSGNGLLVFRDNSIMTDPADNGSHVIGYLRKTGNDAFIFPTGDGSYYKPVAISAPTNTNHHFTAKFFPNNPDPLYNTLLKDPTLNNIDNCEYWILDRTNGNSNVQVTLSWLNASTAPDCQVVSLPELRVARWNGSLWKDEGNSATSGSAPSGTVTSNTVSSFSPFALASVSAINVLPVTLLSFNATPENNAVKLEWTTMSESNNDYFTIEKTQDGINFETVAIVDGAGNSNEEMNYSAYDEHPYDGVSYYRLKQTDFNGEYTYSELQVVHFSVTHHLVVYPNPGNGQLFISIPDAVNESANVQISGMSGNIVFTNNYNLIKGKNILSLNLNNQLSKGIYLMTISYNGTTITEKLVIE